MREGFLKHTCYIYDIILTKDELNVPICRRPKYGINSNVIFKVDLLSYFGDRSIWDLIDQINQIIIIDAIKKYMNDIPDRYNILCDYKCEESLDSIDVENKTLIINNE